MNSCRAIAWTCPGERAAPEYAVQKFFHPEGKPVGFGDALDFGFAVASAQNCSELAETIKSLVVHLDGDNAPEFRPDFFKSIRQWMDVPQVERADFFALISRHFHRILNRAIGRSPADE